MSIALLTFFCATLESYYDK